MSYGLSILEAFWSLLTQMAPYLLLGFAVAGFLAAFVPPDLVERHLGGRGLKPILKSALFGVPLPLCSCGVIPVGASLRKHGAGRGATVAFLLSTPQTGVDSILVTFGLLGPVLAVFRPIAALLTGVLGGALTDVLAGDETMVTQDTGPAVCREACCAPTQKGSRLRRALTYGFISLPADIGNALVVGLILAGLIGVLVPAGFIGETVGVGFGAMLIMMAAGIPVYVCATASVPIAAALIAKGISPGAALVFLMTGPATNAATITTVWKVLGKRTALTYLATVAGMSLLCGIVLDQLVLTIDVAGAGHIHAESPTLFGNICGIVLLVLVGRPVLGSLRAALRKTGEDEITNAPGAPDEPPPVILDVKGMTCSHCAENVRRALLECKGAREVQVYRGRRRAVVHGNNLEPEMLARAVEELGYDAAVHEQATENTPEQAQQGTLGDTP